MRLWLVIFFATVLQLPGERHETRDDCCWKKTGRNIWYSPKWLENTAEELQRRGSVHPDRYTNASNTCSNDKSWQYAWQGKSLKSGDELISSFREGSHGTTIISVGDSLSLQFFSSWVARLRENSAAASDCGHSNDNISFWCSSRTKKRATYVHVDAWFAAISRNDFFARDSRRHECAETFRSSTNYKETHVLDFLGDARWRKQIQHYDIQKYLHTLILDVHQQDDIVLIYNQFAHIHKAVADLAACYLGSRFRQDDDAFLKPKARPEYDAIVKEAYRDLLRWWRSELAAFARIVSILADKLKSVSNRRFLAYYRTSPPSSECWTRNNGASRPLEFAAELDAFADDRNCSEHSHFLVHYLNDLGASAFLAAGHRVLDFETILGLRVDAHPASLNRGRGDALHFCMPGVPDFALDILISTIVADQEKIFS